MTGIALSSTVLALGLSACSSAVSGAATYGQEPCTGETVQPSGAPYCFLVPNGFQKMQHAWLGGDKWPGAVGVDESNIIVTGVIENPKDADSLSDDALVSATDSYVKTLDGLNLSDGKGTLSRVPAGRAVDYHTNVRSQGKTIKLHLYYVYAGHSVLQVNCQSTDRTAEVEKACDDVVWHAHLTSVKSGG